MKLTHNQFSVKTLFRLTLLLTTSAFFTIQASAQMAPAVQWERTIGGNTTDQLSSLQQTTDGGYILGGSSNSGYGPTKTEPPRGGFDFWVVKINNNGFKVWDRTFGGYGNDNISSIKQTPDGGYVLGGTSNTWYINGDKSENTKGGEDFWIVKINATGNKQWDKTIGGPGFDHLKELNLTADGGYILTGNSASMMGADKSEPHRGGNWDYWVVKLDANGNKQWDKTLGGNRDDVPSTIQQTTDGGYIVGGTSFSDSTGDKSQNFLGGYDYWIVKLDANGNKLWDKTIGGANHESLQCLQQTTDGGYIVGGWSDSGISFDKSEASNGNRDYWFVKLDASGNKVWDKTIGGNSDDALNSIQQTKNGNYILAGFSNSALSGDKTQNSRGIDDYWIVMVDSIGNKLWDKTMGGSNYDFIYAVEQTTDNGFVLGGTSNSNTSIDKSMASLGDYDYWIVKLGPEILGTPETQPTFNISISPNPNQGKFKLHLTDLKTDKAEVTITDLLGRKIMEKQLQVTNNQLSEELILPAAKGMYLLQLKAGEEVVTRKIVIE